METKFRAGTVFTVYTRRSNCNKRLIHSGTDYERALERFNTFKVFSGDYKYLNVLAPNSNAEEILMRTTGEGTRQNYQGKHIKPNYEKKLLQIGNIPMSLYKEFSENTGDLSVTQVILALMADFVTMATEQKKELMRDTEETILTYKMDSGLDNTKEVRDYLITNVNTRVDDELL